MHVLTREEIARFGIDRRELVETPWTFENNGRSMVRKTVVQKNDGDESYPHVAVAAVLFQHRAVRTGFAAPGRGQRRSFPRFRFQTAVQSRFTFRPHRSKPPGFDLWGLRMTSASLQSLTALPQFDFTETSQAPDGRRLAHSVKFSSEGLAGALDSLLATCPPPKSAPLQTIGSRDSAAK